MLKIIINADDLGASLNVNRAIEEQIQKGNITSSTIIATGDAFNDAVRMTKMYPNISFGVHLFLDEYDSITKSTILYKYGITDSRGIFIKDAYKKISKYPIELKQAIEEEWCAQIDKVRGAGINISHVDSHHHVHTWPALYDVIKKVLIRNNISTVRLRYVRTFSMYIKKVKDLSCNIKTNYHNTYKPSRLTIVSGVISGYFWNKKMRHYFNTTNFFCHHLTFYVYHDYFLKKYKNGVIETMCHPGHVEYEKETIKLNEIFNNVDKINYNQLFI